MSANIVWTNTDSGTWSDTSASEVRSPFNMEMILRACPALFDAWQRQPFYLDFDNTGAVIVRPVRPS